MTMDKNTLPLLLGKECLLLETAAQYRYAELFYENFAISFL
jgi:hypothetical protein